MTKRLILAKIVISVLFVCITIAPAAAQQRVGKAFSFTVNRNPAYSYASPPGYNNDAVLSYCKALLHKAASENGIPHCKNVYVPDIKDIKASGVKKIINGIGFKGWMAMYFEI